MNGPDFFFKLVKIRIIPFRIPAFWTENVVRKKKTTTTTKTQKLNKKYPVLTTTISKIYLLVRFCSSFLYIFYIYIYIYEYRTYKHIEQKIYNHQTLEIFKRHLGKNKKRYLKNNVNERY